MEKKLFASKRAQRLRVRVRETDLLMLLPFFVASKIKVNYGCKNNPHQMGGSGGNYVLRSLGVLSFCQVVKHVEQPKKTTKHHSSLFVMESFRNRISPGTRNARVISQPGDGSCLYHSISFGLGLLIRSGG